LASPIPPERIFNFNSFRTRHQKLQNAVPSPQQMATVVLTSLFYFFKAHKKKKEEEEMNFLKGKSCVNQIGLAEVLKAEVERYAYAGRGLGGHSRSHSGGASTCERRGVRCIEGVKVKA